MNIHFYLDTEDETPITSFYNLASNPFKIGDELSLDVEELYPNDYNKFTKEIQEERINNNSELQSLFGRKKVKIIKEGKYVRFKLSSEPKLTIEYHCVFLDNSNKPLYS